ncbi:MAG: hypothetical protein J5521_05315 [Lachnospiraceae bacterium]|nr:hypothetical protein [Lachnospiraceae bacterium]
MKRSNKFEDRESTYQMLYTKISKVTAEIDGKKQIYCGQLKELFSDISISTATITRFIWAITHKTEVLPTTLFSIKKNGNKGVIVERLHSGFYDNSGKHIVGMDLIPFIMQAASLHQPKANKARGTGVTVVEKIPTLSKEKHEFNLELEVATSLTGLSGVSDSALAHFGKDAQSRFDKAKSDLDEYAKEVERRENIRQKQQKLLDVLGMMKMNKDELRELLNI